MTPKEKAIQLVEAYWEKIIHDDDGDRNDMCKECALIAVEEILKSRPSLPIEAFGGSINLGECTKLSINFWQQVKTEIEKL